MTNDRQPEPPKALRCPKCQTTDIEEEEQGGSSQRWFVCHRCSHQWAEPRRRPQ